MQDDVVATPSGAPPEPLRLLLAEYVKAALVSDPNFTAVCRGRASQLQALIKARVKVTPASWTLAVMEAEADPEIQRREVVNPMLPTTCPLDLDAVTAGDVEFDRAVQIIRESASFG